MLIAEMIIGGRFNDTLARADDAGLDPRSGQGTVILLCALRFMNAPVTTMTR
jgi:hypothetical protein